MNLNKKQVALTFGIMAALGHFLWTLAVAVGFGQSLLNWSMVNHYMNFGYTVGNVSLGIAVASILAAFVCGYIVGLVFASVWNWSGKRSTKEVKI